MTPTWVIGPTGALRTAIVAACEASGHDVTEMRLDDHVAPRLAAHGDAAAVRAIVLIAHGVGARPDDGTAGRVARLLDEDDPDDQAAEGVDVAEIIDAAAARLARGDGGAVVVLGAAPALAGRDAPRRSAATAALLGAVRAATTRWAPQGVAVNLVTVGPLSSDEAELAATPRAGSARRGASLLGRRVRPSEAAAVVAFLCSQDAAFVNGAVLPVDGGASMGFV